jgi:hypothetical protein
MVTESDSERHGCRRRTRVPGLNFKNHSESRVSVRVTQILVLTSDYRTQAGYTVTAEAQGTPSRDSDPRLPVTGSATPPRPSESVAFESAAASGGVTSRLDDSEPAAIIVRVSDASITGMQITSDSDSEFCTDSQAAGPGPPAAVLRTGVRFTCTQSRPPGGGTR